MVCCSSNENMKVYNVRFDVFQEHVMSPLRHIGNIVHFSSDLDSMLGNMLRTVESY